MDYIYIFRQFLQDQRHLLDQQLVPIPQKIHNVKEPTPAAQCPPVSGAVMGRDEFTG